MSDLGYSRQPRDSMFRDDCDLVDLRMREYVTSDCVYSDADAVPLVTKPLNQKQNVRDRDTNADF